MKAAEEKQLSQGVAKSNLTRLAGILRRKIILVPALAFFCAFAIIWAIVPDPTDEVLNWPISPVLLDDKGEVVSVRLSAAGEWCIPIPLEEMGEWLPKVLVSVEDKRFYSHSGVDFLALGRAVWMNLSRGRVVSGASTISTQLVRLSHPRPRNFEAKLMEFVGAWKVEMNLDKDEILEHYLNRAPFGGPIRGVEAASRLYFGKRAKDLSLGEAALLVGMLKGPTHYRPDRNPTGAQARRRQIIEKVAEQTDFPPGLTALALEEPLPRFNTAMPAKTWHFADLAFRVLPENGGVFLSSLNMQAQSILEQTLALQLEKSGEDMTAAGAVIDNATGRIIAYVGNARFDPVQGRQWVDCAIAPRSPGSTLKPFAYIAALEDGQIIPATLLADTPLRLGGEAPRNFDRHYRGPVRASFALSASLNAPAVRVLRKVKVHNFLKLLREAGFEYLNRDEEVYGDSLVLGAGEVTLLELARAYTALASKGQDRPLLLAAPSKDGESPAWANADGPFPRMPGGLAGVKEQRKAAARGEPAPLRQLYTEAGAYLIADILSDSGRLPFLRQLQQTRQETPVAFKTGTSFGLRDAWTVAYNPSYTVAVWFGKAEGGSDLRLVGLAMASPVADRIIRELSRNVPDEKLWYSPPASLSRTRVCALSGREPSSFCPATKMEWAIPAVWRTVPCDMHALRSGQIVVVWPPELEDFARKRKAGEDLSRRALILSPHRDGKYLIPPGGWHLPIPLKAEGVEYPVHWFAGEQYLGEQSRPDAPLYWRPEAGIHKITLLDADNREAFIDVEIVLLGAQAEEPLPLF